MSHPMFVSVVDVGTGKVFEIEPADPWVFSMELVDRSTEHVVDVVCERPVFANGRHGRERLFVRVVARDEGRARDLVEERRLAWLGRDWTLGAVRRGRLN